jgi:hypothetical protein
MSSVLAWLGVWSLAAGWLLLTNFFLPADGRGWAFAAGGVLLLILAAGQVRWQPRSPQGGSPAVDPWIYLLVPPLAVAAVVWPLPFQAGPLLLLAGLAVMLPLVLVRGRAPSRLSWLAPLGLGLALAGAVWTAQGGVVVGYWWLGARYHQASALTPLLLGLARALDWTVGSSEGSLFLPHIKGMLGATTTWERLGAYPAMLLAAGGLVLLPLVRRHSARQLALRILAALALVLGYLLLRYLVLTAVVAINLDPIVFWLPLAMALTFLPLALLLARVLPLRHSLPGAVAPEAPRPIGRYALLAGLAFIAGLALVGWLLFPDPGQVKAGRVLLDEYNSNWEWSTLELDTEWYGQKSGYNYYSLGQWLDDYYYVDTSFQPRTPELLDGYDVLIIKTPTAPFSPEEIEAIDAWVRAGGGLFLIGDHTNVFGTSSYLNPLARRFGLRFRYDSTYDLPTLRVTLFEPPDLLAHPIVAGMPPFLFATSCTLEAPLRAGNVMVGYGLRALPVDYARRVFFPDKEREQDYPFGLFLQSAAVSHGRGRVVAFTDSTVFSNFTMFMPGKPEYFLGVINWLNYAERWPWLGNLLLVAALLAAGAMVLVVRPLTTSSGDRHRSLDPARATVVVLGVLLLAAAIGPWLAAQVGRARYKLPEPHAEYVRIAFEGEHSRILLPTGPTANPPEVSLQTFYVWTQRLGYVPSFTPGLEEALDSGQVVVIIDPLRRFAPGEIAAIEAFVSGGGRLLVLAEPGREGEAAAAAGQLLAPFGLGLEGRTATIGQIHNTAGEAQGQLQVHGVVTGGEPLLTLGGQAPVVAAARPGDGLVVAAAFARPFSDQQMGTTSVVPNEYQRFLFEIEFWLMRGLVTGEFQPLRVPVGAER